MKSGFFRSKISISTTSRISTSHAKAWNCLGYEVDTCYDGEEALAGILTENYDLVVLDPVSYTHLIHIWQYREGKLVDRQRAGLSYEGMDSPQNGTIIIVPVSYTHLSKQSEYRMYIFPCSFLSPC